MFFVAANTFSYLLSKNIYTLYTCNMLSTCRLHVCHAWRACASHIARVTRSVVSLLLSPAKLCSNERNQKNYFTTFILTPQSKSKSKHYNLFKKKKEKKKINQRKRANTKQKGYNVNPFQSFCGLQGAQNVYLVDGISAANKIDGF